MINLLVDEAYAFDYMAILEVKKNLYTSEQKETTFKQCKNFLQLEVPLFDEIYESKEYEALYNINLLTFNLIDQLREGKDIPAIDIDNANMDRFRCKQSLQNRFFSNSQLKEEKVTK
jgi:hypothetical protein